MMEIDSKYSALLLEALEELMYKLSLQLEDLKGQPLSNQRRALTQKQSSLEELQHVISAFLG